MKVFVIDGTFESKYKKIIDKILFEININNEVDLFKIENEEMNYCSGCWDCWVKTPGVCAHKDVTPNFLTRYINSDFVIHITENSLGTVTSLTKNALDKTIPSIHPYLVIEKGESRHRKRYDKYPQWGFIYLDQEKNDHDFEIVKHYFDRVVMNAKTKIMFSDRFDGKEGDLNESNLIKWFT